MPVALQANVLAAGRSRQTGAEPLIMATATSSAEQLERELLLRGLGALAADRNSCSDCGRTPLTGEKVHLYEGREHRVVCELCRTRRRESPVSSMLVRHCEHGHTVRLTARVTAAVPPRVAAQAA
jgi:hypothetical protein